MKKILILLSIMILALSVNVFADTTVKVLLNDQYMDFRDENNQVVNPEITNSRTMVPLRKIFESLDAKVDWDNDTRTVIAKKDTKTIKLTIGSEEAYIIENGYTTMKILDSVAYIKDGRTLVPLRFISESLGCLVGWNQEERTAIIISPEDLSEEVLNECTTFKEFITSLKVSDKKYFNINLNYEGGPNGQKNPAATCKLNIFNNENNLILNILDIYPDEDGISGNYYDAGTIIEESTEMESLEFINLFLDSDDIQKGVYTKVKEKCIEFLNNKNLKVEIKGNKKIYTLKNRLELLMEMANLNLDINIDLVTENDVLTNIDADINITDIGALIFKIDIEYLDNQKSLPANVELRSIMELLFR